MTRDPNEHVASLRRQHFTDEARTDRKAMFRFVAKGELDFKKLEKTHAQERQELADLQKAATGEEIRAIRQDTTERRAEAREHHQERIDATWERYTDPMQEAFQKLDTARRMERAGDVAGHEIDPAGDLDAERLEASKRVIEGQARDMSKGEIAERDNRPMFGFGPQGLQQQGLSFGRGGRDDDEDERPFKPPSQAFNPK